MNHCQSKQTNENKPKELWCSTLQNANVPPIGDGFMLAPSHGSAAMSRGAVALVPHHTEETHTGLRIVVLVQY